MFPPKPRNTAEEWVEDLWLSLQRAAPQWSDAADVEMDEGKASVTLFLNDRLDSTYRKTVGRIIRDYAKEAGWKVEKILLKDYVVFFVASKA